MPFEGSLTPARRPDVLPRPRPGRPRSLYWSPGFVERLPREVRSARGRPVETAASFPPCLDTGA